MALSPEIPFFILAITLLLGIAYANAGFSYYGKNGPNEWGSLDPKFSACSSGKHQSPINIQKNMTVINKQLQAITRDYKPVNATLVNHGFNIGVHFKECPGEAIIDGKNYSFVQMHWHTPSEHRIHGERFAAELHMVHRAADYSVAVLSVLFKENEHASDPLLSKMQKELEQLAKEIKADEEPEIVIGDLDIKHLKQRCRKYYRYAGSFTSPPCSENVTWIIFGKVRSISKDQVAALHAPLRSDCKNNARPCQALHNRKVELYTELNEVD